MRRSHVNGSRWTNEGPGERRHERRSPTAWLAHAPRHRHQRLHHRDPRFRTAFGSRFLPYAAVAGQRLGSRRFRARFGDSESVVGDRPAFRRRHRRPIRHRARAVRGRAPLCARARADGLFANARHAASVRRRADRLRAVRVLVQYRDRRVRKARPRSLGAASPSARRRPRDRSASSCSRRCRSSCRTPMAGKTL